MKKVVHFEIPADDMERAKQFYSIFEWNIQDWPMPDGSVHTGIHTVAVDETMTPTEYGAINGMLVPRDAVIRTPTVAVNVPSVDDYIAKAQSAGGRLVKEKVVFEGMGAYAYVEDTEGNVIGLWEDAVRG